MINNLISDNIAGKKTMPIKDIVLSFIFIFSFFFHQFSSFVPGVTLGELLLIAGSLFIIIFNYKSLRIEKTLPLIIIYFFSLLFSFITIHSYNNPFSLESSTTIFSRFVRYGAYLLFFVSFCDNFRPNSSFYKIYEYSCLVISVYAILQFVFYYAFHVFLPYNILPFLNRPRDLTSNYMLNMADSNYFRSYGVFDEPAYLAEFLIPYFILKMFNYQKKFNSVFCLFLVVLAILFSASVQGIVMMIVGFACFILFRSKREKKDLIFTLVLLFVIGALGFIFLNTSIGARVFAKLLRIGNANQGDYSIKLRLFRGFALFGELDVLHKFFGVGMGNAANFSYANNIYTDFDYVVRSASNLEYMSGLSRVLVENGLLIFIVFAIFLILLFMRSKSSGKTLIIVYFLLLVSGSGLFTLESIFYVFLILNCSNRIIFKNAK